MKQKWPILIFSALLTAFIVLAGIWGNAQFQQLPSGGVLTAQQAAKGIAPDGWRQEAPGQWHFTFTAGEDLSSLTLCVTNTAAPLETERLTDLARSGELYALDVTPGETMELVFACRRSPQTWLMSSAFADRAFRFRTLTQLITLTAFVTMGVVVLALYHYKHQPELGYFLLYLVIMSAWALMVFFFPAIRSGPLQLVLRSFFAFTVLASALSMGPEELTRETVKGTIDRLGVPGTTRVVVTDPAGEVLCDWYEGAYQEDRSDEAIACLRPGTDITLLTYGTLINEALSAADLLAQRGISAQVLKLSTIAPLDPETVRRALTGTKRLLVLEDCVETGCVGQRVAAVMAQLGMAPRRLVLKNTGDRFIPQGSVAELRHLCGLDAEGVAAAAEEAVHEQ